MAYRKINDAILYDIADAIREKNGEIVLYKPSEMPQAIRDIETGGGGGGTPHSTANTEYNLYGLTGEKTRVYYPYFYNQWCYLARDNVLLWNDSANPEGEIEEPIGIIVPNNNSRGANILHTPSGTISLDIAGGGMVEHYYRLNYTAGVPSSIDIRQEIGEVSVDPWVVSYDGDKTFIADGTGIRNSLLWLIRAVYSYE